MMAIKLRKMVRARRGQTMVLGSLGVLIVGIMMMLTLNVGQAVHEKVRIQQLADGAAFSMAVQEARAYNFIAYTNRANVGALVSASSMHSFHSMASSIPEMFQAAGYTFFMHAGIEFAMCFTCCWPFCFSMCKHCYHGIKDLDAAFNYLDSADELREKVKKADKTFRLAMNALDAHMVYISANQKAVAMGVWMQLLQDDITTSLRDEVAPQASGNGDGLKFINAGTFGAASGLTGMRGFSDVFESDKERQQFVPTMIANGTRYSKTRFGFTLNNWFVSDRGLLEAYAFTHPQTLIKLLYKDGKPAKGFSFPIMHEGQGRTIKDPNDPKSRIKSNDLGPDGNTAAAYDSGIIMSMGFICIFSMIPMIMTYSAHVASGPDGGDHEDRSSCDDESKHKFKCLDLAAGPAACFAVFKPDKNPKHNFGQPAAYAVINQDLSMLSDGTHGAWEVDMDTDANGSIGIQLQEGGDKIEVNIANRAAAWEGEEGGSADYGRGVAMSKALVYYHLPRYRGNGWKEQPNLFNPYWRAKLHPFREMSLSSFSMEPMLVLAMGGASHFAAAVPMAPMP
jgi:hypothetical protein